MNPYWRGVLDRKETPVEPLLVCPMRPLSDPYCKMAKACYIDRKGDVPGRTECRVRPAEVPK